MCGIAGFFGSEINQAQAQSALDAIAHRGPDDEGIYRDGPALLLHRRLSIIDVSNRGHQPMVDEDTGVAVVFNGEIYNYKSLRTSYCAKPYKTDSDTEVILHTYLAKGMEFVHELRGMFSIAIWDPRDQRLILVRDRFGIKPLHYWIGPKGLAFGSEIKSIFALGAPADLDIDTAYDYLGHGLLAHCPQTFFKNIVSLPQGSMMSVDLLGNTKTQSYWSPMEVAERVSEGSSSSIDPEKDMWDLFRETLDIHTLSDVPIGVTLSSGLDSRFLMHTLAAIGWKDVDAFTYSFDEEEYDEARRIDLSSFPLNIRHHVFKMKPESVISTLEEAVRIFETPVGGVGTLGLYNVMRMASQAGIKVILAGEGSDEAMAGYRYYGYSRLRDLYDNDSADLYEECSEFSRLQGELIMPGTPVFEERIVKRDSVVWAPDGTVLAGEPFLGEAFDACRAEESWARSYAWHPKIPEGSSHLRKALMRDLYSQKIPKLLWFQDRVSMAWGIESRVPFLDHQLYEFIASLDDDWLIRRGVSKYILRQLYQRYCKINLQTERKHFVSTPQREWIKGPLRDVIKERINNGYLVKNGLIDYPIFEASYDSYCSSAELGNSFFIWKVLNLELLLSSFLTTNK